MYIGSIDSGTSSTRFMIFNKKGDVVSVQQHEHIQYYPGPGLVEHDPQQIWTSTCDTISKCLLKANLKAKDILTIGITNQRETTIVWNKDTGLPYHNAVVWNDTRTQSICDRLSHNYGIDRFRNRTGLPIATYFSVTKLMFLLESIPQLRSDANAGVALFGTVDTYLIWKMTGGKNHVTDVTNASRTMLMNIHTLEWDDELLEIFQVPRAMLPKILSSADKIGFGRTCANSIPDLANVPITGVLGDQQASLFGHNCFEKGQAKCTYGTGGFLLLNTGVTAVPSKCGLLTTVAYQLSSDLQPVYALEGAVAYCGSTIQWLRDNLKIIETLSDSETKAKEVNDNGGVYFVPAFSGLLAPRWRSDARGVIVGLSAYNTSAHITRAALEATAFQTAEVLDAMRYDSGLALSELRVDGGMSKNGLLMQFVSDLENIPITSPTQAEMTALGAALIAGLAIGYWENVNQIKEVTKATETSVWRPGMNTEQRIALKKQWAAAVERSLGWTHSSPTTEVDRSTTTSIVKVVQSSSFWASVSQTLGGLLHASVNQWILLMTVVVGLVSIGVAIGKSSIGTAQPFH